MKRLVNFLALLGWLIAAPALAANNVGPLYPANNLADLNDILTARTNILAAPQVANRTALASFSVSSTENVWLAETGRWGYFKFSGANLSTQVTSDPQQAIYVARASDPTGTTGAFVRQFSGAINVQWFGVTCDGSTDDRATFQAALTYAPTHSTVWVPSTCTARIVNATGTAGIAPCNTGTTLVQQRCNAVANSTLFPLTSSVDFITLKIDGRVFGTSALADVFDISGGQAAVIGPGQVYNTSGTFLDTTSTDPALQWYPTLINMAGIGATVSGLNTLNAPTTAIWMQGDLGTASGNIILGGPAAHGAGTVQFGIMLGDSAGGGQTGMKAIGNTVANSGSGAPYTGVFSNCAEAVISNNIFNNLLEHGAYLYGESLILSNNSVNDSAGAMFAAALQVFAVNSLIENNALTGHNNDINVERMISTTISGNQGGNITLRTFQSETTTVDTVLISNNIMRSSGQHWPIDVTLDQSIKNLTITGNNLVGGGDSLSGARGSITVSVNVTYTAKNVIVSNNQVRTSNTYGLLFERGVNMVVTGNTFEDVNGVDGVSAIRGLDSNNGVVSGNRVVNNVLSTTSLIAKFTTVDGNSKVNAYGNSAIGLAGTGEIIQVPNDSERRGNLLGDVPNTGTFTTTAATTANVSTSALRASSGATILLTPLNATAALQQAGANPITGAAGTGLFAWTTAAAGAASAGGIFFYEVVQ